MQNTTTVGSHEVPVWENSERSIAQKSDIQRKLQERKASFISFYLSIPSFVLSKYTVKSIQYVVQKLALHFALELELLREQGSLSEWTNLTWSPTWLAMEIMDYKILCQAHLKEVYLPQNWETITPQNLTNLDWL